MENQNSVIRQRPLTQSILRNFHTMMPVFFITIVVLNGRPVLTMKLTVNPPLTVALTRINNRRPILAVAIPMPHPRLMPTNTNHRWAILAMQFTVFVTVNNCPIHFLLHAHVSLLINEPAAFLSL